MRLLDPVSGWCGLPVSGWDGGYSTQTLDDAVYLWVAEMVVTRLRRWMTRSTCEWLRWWLLDSDAGWRGLPVSGWEVVTRLSRWMTWSTWEWLRWWLLDSVAGWRGLPVSGWGGGYLTQWPDDMVYLRVDEMVVTRLSPWMTWSTCEWLRSGRPRHPASESSNHHLSHSQVDHVIQGLSLVTTISSTLR